MSRIIIFVFAVVCILCSNADFFSAASPSVKVTSPPDASVSLTRTVNVTGTASGSDAFWLHTSPEDFESGASEDLAMAGNDVSNLKIYDDFDSDYGLSYLNWTPESKYGLYVGQSDGTLHLSGKGTSSTNWAPHAWVMSTRTVARNVSADLVSITGTGTSWVSTVGMIQDLSNYVMFGVELDPSLGSDPKVYLALVQDGIQTVYTYGKADTGTHNYALGLWDGSLDVYRDGTRLATEDLQLDSPRMWLFCSVQKLGDTVDAKWDNASLSYFGGSVTLATTYDDFNDNVLMGALWAVTARGGLTVGETGGRLITGGTCNSGTLYNGAAWVASTRTVTETASADLVAYSGSGTGWVGVMGLFQDASNYIMFGAINDFGAYGSNTKIYLSIVDAGSQQTFTFGDLSVGFHKFTIGISGGSASYYVDSGLVSTKALPSSTYHLWLLGMTRANGDTVSATWDNATIDTVTTGVFNSASFDTRSVNPVLKKVQWNATALPSTTTTVQLRSADAPNMTDATSWTDVTNGQSTGLPQVKRYLQFKATLKTSDQKYAPELKDIRLSYFKPVKLVEVSIDDRTTWKTATGTDAWSVSLDMPENSSTIWVRATDVADDTDITSLSIDVDSTPPTAVMAINDGAEFTTGREVELSLDAEDAYGVSSMMASEDPEFGDLEWADYAETLPFTLSLGDGLKTVFTKFRDANGWESVVYNASIYLDTQPPAGSIVVDGGAQYTQNTTVSVYLNISDLVGIDGMMVFNDPNFRGVPWSPFSREVTVELGPGSGDRTVYAKFRDRAGHVSGVFSDAIIVDQTPPGVTLKCNGGAGFTSSPNVTVELAAAEDNQVVSMQLGVGDASSITGLPWADFAAQNNLTLPSGDGTKTISARLQDSAGNIGTAGSTTIVLDTVAPRTTLGSVAATSLRAKINVTWSGADDTSGVLWYDVQYKAGNGTWKDLLSHTNLTATDFTGADLETYSFRARAQDRAGNLEPFQETVDNAVTVALPEPAVTIDKPALNAELRGKATVSGSCAPVSGGRNVTRVELRVDNGTWETADGTLKWSFGLDTTKLKDGKHTLQVRTYDGKHYSTVIDRPFRVKNAQEKGFLGADGGLLLVACVGIALAILSRRRGR